MTNEEIYNKYVKEVYKYLYFVLKNKEQSEDLTSETFLRFFENKNEIKADNVKPYIIGIARNLCFDKFRDKSYYNINLINQKGESIEAEDSKYNMENEVIDQNLTQLIKKQLNRLDKLSQEIIILKIWEEFKFDEIAEIVKQNPNTVKTIYYTAIEELRFKLNSNNQIQIKAITISLILSSILFISKENEFNITNIISNNILNNSIFFNTLRMNTTMGTTASVAKLGFLATTTGKIIVGVSSIAVITAVGTGAVIINNNKTSTQSGSLNNSSSLSSMISSSSVSNSSVSSVTPDVKQFTSSKYGLKFYYFSSMGDAVESSVSQSSSNNSVSFANSKLVFTFPKNEGAIGGPTSIDFSDPIIIQTKSGRPFTIYIRDGVKANTYTMFGSWKQSDNEPSNNIWVTVSEGVSKDQMILNINSLKYLIPTMDINLGLSISSNSSVSSVTPDVKQFTSSKYGLKFYYFSSMGDAVESSVSQSSSNNSVSFANSKLVFTFPKNEGAIGGPTSIDFSDPIIIQTKSGRPFTIYIRDGVKANTYTMFGSWKQSDNEPSNNIWVTVSEGVSKDQMILNINSLKYLIPTMDINLGLSISSNSSVSSVTPDVKQFTSSKYGLKFYYFSSMGDAVESSVSQSSSNNSVSFANSKLVFTFPKNEGAIGGPTSIDFSDPIIIQTKSGRPFTIYIRDGVKANTYTMFGSWKQSDNEPSNNIWVTVSEGVSKDQMILNINSLKYLIPTMDINF